MTRKSLVVTLTLALLSFASILFVSSGRAQFAEGGRAAGARVYELRTYHTNEGKLEALHARFRDHTSQLFVRHGMTLIGYWTPQEGDGNTLIYIIGHESREQARKNWAAFGMDPDWRAAYEASIADGKLVAKIDSVFLDPTDYSPLR